MFVTYFTLSVIFYHPGRRRETELSVCGKFEGLGGWDVVGLQWFCYKTQIGLGQTMLVINKPCAKGALTDNVVDTEGFDER